MGALSRRGSLLSRKRGHVPEKMHCLSLKVNRNLTQQLILNTLATAQLRVNWWRALTGSPHNKGAKLFKRGWNPAQVREIWWWAYEVLQRTSEMEKLAQRQRYFQFSKDMNQCNWCSSPKIFWRGSPEPGMCGHSKESSEPREPEWRSEKLQCQRNSTSSPTSWWGMARKYKASPESLHFILKTILGAAFDVQGLRDTKMTHSLWFWSPKAKIFRAADYSINHNTGWSKHLLCTRPRSTVNLFSPLPTVRGRHLWVPFCKWGTEAQTIRRLTVTVGMFPPVHILPSQKKVKLAAVPPQVEGENDMGQSSPGKKGTQDGMNSCLKELNTQITKLEKDKEQTPRKEKTS